MNAVPYGSSAEQIAAELAWLDQALLALVCASASAANANAGGHGWYVSLAEAEAMLSSSDDLDPGAGRSGLPGIAGNEQHHMVAPASRGIAVDVEKLGRVLEHEAALLAGLAHRGIRQVRDGTRGVGDAVEVGVVEGEQVAVRRGVHVGLEIAVAEPHGGAERGQGVLEVEVVGVQRAARWASPMGAGASR